MTSDPSATEPIRQEDMDLLHYTDNTKNETQQKNLPLKQSQYQMPVIKKCWEASSSDMQHTTDGPQIRR